MTAVLIENNAALDVGQSQPVSIDENAPFEPARLTVEMYHRLVDSGVFADNERFELLEGVLVAKMVKGTPHVVCLKVTRHSVGAVLPAGWHTQEQDPITLSDSEPEPDLVIVRGLIRDFGKRLPGGGDVGMVCEVADTSLTKDRLKARIYGRGGIPWYWIINIKARCIECRSQPFATSRRSGYRNLRVYEEDEEIPLILDGVEIARFAVRDLLPDAE